MFHKYWIAHRPKTPSETGHIACLQRANACGVSNTVFPTSKDRNSRGESWSCRSHTHLLTAMPQQFPPRFRSGAPFPVSASQVLCTFDLLSCATLLCVLVRRSVAASFSRSKSMLLVRIAWPAARAVHGAFFSRPSEDEPSLFEPRLAGPGLFSRMSVLEKLTSNLPRGGCDEGCGHFASHFVMRGVLQCNLAEGILRTKNTMSPPCMYIQVSLELSSGKRSCYRI